MLSTEKRIEAEANPAGSVKENTLATLETVQTVLKKIPWIGAIKVGGDQYQLFCRICKQFNASNTKAIYINIDKKYQT